MAEMYIPTDRVPPEILNKLREIGLLLQSETAIPRFAHSSSSPSLSSNKKDVDECDDLSSSCKDSNPVVHVLRGEVFSGDSGQKDGSIVSLLERESPPEDSSSLGSRQGPTETLTRTEESDVVSVLSSQSAFSHSSTKVPQPQPSPSKQSTFSPSAPQYSSQSCHGHGDVSDTYTSHATSTANLHRMSPLLAVDVEGDRRVINSRSPCKNALVHEEGARLPHSSSFTFSHNQSIPESAMAAVLSSPPSQSSHSRSPPSQHDDDIVRVIPPRSATPSEEVDEKSPKVLTPPETPENELKRVVPEVFTFDDFACTQERFRQTLERLQKVQDQSTPATRSPSTPRHPPSAPSTPSFWLQDSLRSPSVRRISPVDQCLMSRRETASAVIASPQSKLKAPEVPTSPVPSMPATPHRLTVQQEEYSPQRRGESPSPKPKKRLSFDEDGVPPHVLQAQRLRGYEVGSAPSLSYPLSSPRPSGSGSGSYSADFARMAPGTPSKHSMAMAEFKKRMASLAAYQDERVGLEDERGLEDVDGDERAGLFYPGGRHGFEASDFLAGRAAMQAGRYTLKRKRSDLMEESSDAMAMCTCAVMERNFLQMAECAYKRIRRIDTTPADFDRFRNELAQTNDILRESMGLMKHIRDLCDHRKRPRW